MSNSTTYVDIDVSSSNSFPVFGPVMWAWRSAKITSRQKQTQSVSSCEGLSTFQTSQLLLVQTKILNRFQTGKDVVPILAAPKPRSSMDVASFVFLSCDTAILWRWHPNQIVFQLVQHSRKRLWCFQHIQQSKWSVLYLPYRALKHFSTCELWIG